MLGIVGALILIRTDRSRYPSLFAENFGWLPITVGVGTYPLWWWYSKRMGITPASQFFEISAGVLPVLLLAAVVDVRRSRSLKSYQLVLPIVAVFLGEIAALNILAFGEDQKAGSIQATAVDFAVVAASLTSTVIALVLAVLADLEEN